MKGTYIDVRGPHPVLFIGLIGITLNGARRDISVIDAMTSITVRPPNPAQEESRFVRLNGEVE